MSELDKLTEVHVLELVQFLFSDHLKTQLEDYIRDYPKVKVVRTKQREGLIRARLLGFSNAKGDVVTFLDSHCECTIGTRVKKAKIRLKQFFGWQCPELRGTSTAA